MLCLYLIFIRLPVMIVTACICLALIYHWLSRHFLAKKNGRTAIR
ncbi:hypothetical protein SAMN05421881_101428 [Nitrosomonas halophila]|uniref:Uncharacterized protein n=1 Tax=Nitrosomonas halophila TaxID=44576 RepID=A0A1H3G5Z6_9PROT|nr:hypothetical protein SAMN05421881_101428 [Nitrosomonas halophila]